MSSEYSRGHHQTEVPVRPPDVAVQAAKIELQLGDCTDALHTIALASLGSSHSGLCDTGQRRAETPALNELPWLLGAVIIVLTQRLTCVNLPF